MARFREDSELDLMKQNIASLQTGKQNSIAQGSNIADAATTAATNAPTDLNPSTTLLGTLVGEVNATNAKQNDLASKYNDLATKFNTLLSFLEARGLLAS